MGEFDNATITIPAGMAKRMPGFAAALRGAGATVDITGQAGAQMDIEDPDVLGTVPENDAKIARAGNIAADRLRSLIERIERLEEERKALGADIKDIFVEAKSAGFDVKVMRQLIVIRRQEPAEVEEQETLLDVCRRALGM